MNEIKVAELFAGVGGFRQGLKQASERFNVVFSNQWEPATKRQYASEIYIKNFGSINHYNEDITEFPISLIPDHELLVGGFPCQDYSVARTLNQAEGLVGKKGVLWWAIHRILKGKGEQKPKFLFLENVDRLLKSPGTQRGRDFAIMLASLSELGYIVEWRVINAAEYGMPQRRRRVFIFAYHESSDLHKEISQLADPIDWILRDGVLAESFNVKPDGKIPLLPFELLGELDEISREFGSCSHGSKEGKSPFENCGLIVKRKVYTVRTGPVYNGDYVSLGDVILQNGDVPESYYLDPSSLQKWKYLKGAKKDNPRKTRDGFEYNYNEGPMAFPDPLNKPARTIVTGEGGATPSRFKHVIEYPKGRYRRLTPIELERLNMFPVNHTEGVPDAKRAFFMGNALVVGIIEKIGKTLERRLR